MSQPLHIVIVDDQTLLREGFRKLLELEPDIAVVGMAGDGEEALALAERLYASQTPPDVFLLDIRMPKMDGIAAAQALKARWPDVHIVILTTFDDDELIYAGLRAGALGYLLKDSNGEQLINAIRAAARGEVLLQPHIADKVFAGLTQPGTPKAPPSTSPTMAYVEELTERERSILKYIANGKSNKEIGESLYITEGTVKNHVSSILSKLGLRDRTQAALYAREHLLS